MRENTCLTVNSKVFQIYKLICSIRSAAQHRISPVTQNKNQILLTCSCCPVCADKYQDDLRDNSFDFFTPEVHGELRGCFRRAQMVCFFTLLQPSSSSPLSHFPDSWLILHFGVRSARQHPPGRTAMTAEARGYFLFSCTLQTEGGASRRKMQRESRGVGVREGGSEWESKILLLSQLQWKILWSLRLVDSVRS